MIYGIMDDQRCHADLHTRQQMRILNDRGESEGATLPGPASCHLVGHPAAHDAVSNVRELHSLPLH